mgnify:FL=1
MNRIKQLRNEKNINQDVLAKLLGLEIAGISKLETGRVPLKDEYIVKLAEYFGVSTDYILGKSDNRNNDIAVSKIPILGTVKAGYDWLAEENIVDYITLKENIPNVGEYYALRITGDSMLPLLAEGDLVIVHDQDDVESGQTAVILINGEEATVKKVVKTNEGIELHAMNPYYPVKKFTFEDMQKIPVKIIGRVKEAKIKGAL